MIRFYIGNQERSATDILYKAAKPMEVRGNELFTVEMLKDKDDVAELGTNNTFFLMDQTPLANPKAAMIAHLNNSSILLVNKPPVTLEETLTFYEQLSITTGAVFGIGNSAYQHLRDFNARTGHIKCALEEVDEVTYSSQYKLSKRAPGDKLKVYFDDRISEVFYGSCLRKWSAENPVLTEEGFLTLQPSLGDFEKVNTATEADLFVTFRTYTREYMRMLTQRFSNVYVPFIDEYRVFDPRSFFKVGNMTYINDILGGTTNVTDHQIAGQFKSLFADMYQYMQDVFVAQYTKSTVNNMKLSGSNDLFSAIAYNLNRTI